VGFAHGINTLETGTPKFLYQCQVRISLKAVEGCVRMHCCISTCQLQSRQTFGSLHLQWGRCVDYCITESQNSILQYCRM